MINILSCLPGSHDPLYVAVGALMALIGSYLFVNLFRKALVNRGHRRALLVILSGTSAGATIWTAHFIWMLGIEFPFPHSYEVTGLALSLVLSVATATLGFYIATIRESHWVRALAGAVIGSGIGVMHYVGMLALNVPAVKDYDLRIVALSWGLGVSLSVLAFSWPSAFSTRHPKLVTATIFALAITCLHYTGMTGLEVRPELVIPGTGVIHDRDLVFAVIAMAAMIMAMGSAAFAFDSRNSGERLKDMEHRAFHDTLTGLPNRAMLEDTLTIIALMVPHGRKLAIVNFDLNRFKDINDVHGHAAGDAVLVTVAARLKESMRGGEFVCRVGGDEFVAFKRDIGSREDAYAFTERLRQAIVPDIDWNGNPLGVGCSMGVSVFPDDGTKVTDLMVKADLAMYRAKRDRLEEAVFYDGSIDEENRDKSALSIDLRKALENGQLELVYQRQNSIADGSLIGYEVLSRWRHPERGYVTPDVFIPIAERDGVINEIGEWVLRKACAEAASWPTPAKIAVNVAARQLANNNLPEIVSSALAESGLPSDRLEIEITESGIIADARQALKIVRELKRIGVSIAMDDFGTGYSSLSTLQSFPFDKIKIDKAFVLDVSKSSQSQAIVKSTIVLGNALQIAVMAEGVENEDDLEFLRREGCTQAQGFLFGQPMSAAEIAAA